MLLAPTLSLLSSGSGAIVRPTFSRDFAGERTLNNGTGPAIAFTRASGATFFDADGVLQTAANDVPRFDHDPVNGNSRGLLIEESRQNLFQRSEEFDNVYWGTIDATVVANAATSPASTLTADRVHPSGNSAASVFFRNVAASASATYSASLFMKAAGKTFGFLQINFNQSSTPIRAFAFTIDLSNGTLGTQQDLVGATTGVTATATSVGSGWYRIAMSFTTTALTDEVAFLPGPCDAANSRTVTASGTDGIFAWGAQLEAGAFPTSYIPTTTVAVERLADSAVVTPISGFYNASEGTIYNEFSVPVLDGASTLRGVTQFAEAAAITNRLQTGFRGTGAYRFDVVAANASEVAIESSAGAFAAGAVVKAAQAYKSGDNARSLNGVSAATSSSAITTPTRERFRFGDNGTAALNGHIRKVAYFPRRLSNALLQSLTT